MNSILFSEDRRDALQEVFNIAIGQASASLAVFLDAFVKLSVPTILIVKAHQLSHILLEMIGRKSEISVIRQAFFNNLLGESLTVYREEDADDMIHLIEAKDDPIYANKQELLLDVSNILVGACLKGVAAQFKMDIHFSPPTLFCSTTPIEKVFHNYPFAWEDALLIKVVLRLENRSTAWYLLFFVPSDSIELMCQEIDRLLK